MLDAHVIEDEKADWERIPEADWTPVQRRAAETNGLDTPANRWTAAGTAIALDGALDISREHYVAGTIKTAVGYACDYWDGSSAEKHQVKSPSGEIADVVADRIKMAATVAAVRKAGKMSVAETVAVATINVVNSGISLYAKAKKREIHKNNANRSGYFAQAAGITARVASAAVGEKAPRVAETLHKTGTVGIVGGVAVSALGGVHLARQAFKPSPAELEQDEAILQTD